MEDAFHGWMKTTVQSQPQLPHLYIFTFWKDLWPVAYIWLELQWVHQNVIHFGKLTPLFFLKRTMRFLLTTERAFSTTQNPHRPHNEHPMAYRLTNTGWPNILVFGVLSLGMPPALKTLHKYTAKDLTNIAHWLAGQSCREYCHY